MIDAIFETTSCDNIFFAQLYVVQTIDIVKNSATSQILTLTQLVYICPSMKHFFEMSGVYNSFEGEKYNMLAQSVLGKNRCIQCSIDFDTPHELQNHKRRFCMNSGYDNLEGLAKIECQGTNPSHKPAFSKKKYLQQYGSNSLATISEHRLLTEDNLGKDMHNIHKFKRQLEGVRKYNHGEAAQSQVSSQHSKMGQSKLTHHSYSQSRLDEELKRYDKPLKESAISPPTFIDQLNMRNHTVLDKSNSSLGRMPLKDKIEYAKVKLDELTSIKALYIENGGNRPEFKANIEKMITFYQNFLNEQKVKQTHQDNGSPFNESQLIESRCSTPILKLRSLDQSRKGSEVSNATTSKRIKTSQKAQKNGPGPSQQADNFAQYNGLNYGYPGPIMMMPYPQPQPQNDGFRVLEKMIELKSEENHKLLQILLQDRRKSNQAFPSYPPPPNSLVQGSKVESMGRIGKGTKTGMIDETEDYQFKKSMVEDLISQEKVLLALQQEELDELKLLSQLPKELQGIKLQSAIKSSETRFQVEKQLLKQKMQRLTFQEQNQNFQEQRKFNNDRWAGEERKKLLEQQMGRYLDNFESQLINQDSNPYSSPQSPL